MSQPILHWAPETVIDDGWWRHEFLQSYMADLRELDWSTTYPVEPGVKSISRDLGFVRYCVVRVESPCMVYGGMNWIGIEDQAGAARGVNQLLDEHRQKCDCGHLSTIEERYPRAQAGAGE